MKLKERVEIYGMGWGQHVALREAHYMMRIPSSDVRIKTLCELATAMYWQFRDVDADMPRCMFCRVIIEKIEKEAVP